MKFLVHLILTLMVIQSGTLYAQGYTDYIDDAQNALNNGEYAKMRSYLQRAELACNPCNSSQKNQISALRNEALQKENKNLRDLLDKYEALLKEKNLAQSALNQQEIELKLTNLLLQPEARYNVPSLLYLANQYLDDNSSRVLRDQVYRKMTNGAIYQFEFLDSHSHKTNYVSIAHDSLGKKLVVGFGHEDESFIRIYDGDTGGEKQVLAEPNLSVLAIDMSADGKYVISGGIDPNDHGFIHIWNTETASYEVIEGLDAEGLLKSEAIRCINFFPLPDNEYVAIGTHDGRIFIIDIIARKITKQFKVFEEAIWNMDIIRYEDKWMLLASGKEGVVKTYLMGKDFQYQRQVGELSPRDSINHVHYASFFSSSDSVRILGGGCKDQLQYFTINRPLTEEWSKHDNEIRSIDTWGKGELFVSADYDGEIYLKNVPENRSLRFRHSRSVDEVIILPDGKRVFSASQDGSARVWDIEFNELALYYDHVNRDRKGHQYVLSENAEFILNGHELLDNSHDWELKREFEFHIDDKTPAAISNDGKYIAVRDENNRADILIVNQAGTQRIDTLKNHTSAISSLCFSKGGDSLLSGSDNGEIICWKWKSGDYTQLKGHAGKVMDLAFTPDGEILSAGADRQAYWWTRSGEKRVSFEGHFRAVTQIEMSPQKDFVVTGSEDQTIRIWDMKGNLLNVLGQHHGTITALSIASHGQQILSGSQDSIAYLWDKQGYLMYQINEFKSPVKRLAFTEGDKSMIIVFENGRCQFVKAIPSLETFFASEEVYKPKNLALERLKYDLPEKPNEIKSIKDPQKREEIALFYWQKASRNFTPDEKRKLLIEANQLFRKIPLEHLSLEGAIAKMLVAENLGGSYSLDNLLTQFPSGKISFAKALLEEAQFTTDLKNKVRLSDKGLIIMKQIEAVNLEKRSIEIIGGLLLEKTEAAKLVDYIDPNSDEQRLIAAEYLWRQMDEILGAEAKQNALLKAMEALEGTSLEGQSDPDYILWYLVMSHELNIERNVKSLLVDINGNTMRKYAEYLLDRAEKLDLNSKTQLRIGESILQLYEWSSQKLEEEEDTSERLKADDFAELYYELGKEALLLREYDLAQNSLKRINELTPDSPPEHMLKGHTQLIAGELELAFASYEKVNKPALSEKILIVIRDFKEQGILTVVDSSLIRFQERVLFGKGFGGDFNQVSDTELKVAADFYVEEVKVAKANSAKLYCQLRLVAIHEIMLKKSTDFLSRKTAETVLNQYYFDLSLYQLYESQYNEALVSITKARELNPEDDKINARTTVVYALLEDWDNTKLYFDAISAKIEPQSGLTYKRWITREVEQISASNMDKDTANTTNIDLAKVEAVLEGS